MKRKNVVFFVNSLDSGGIENYLLRFLRDKSKDFSEIFVYCKSGRGGQLEDDYIELNNVKVIKKSLSYLYSYRYKELTSFFIKNDISVICDFTGNFSGLVLKAAHSANISNRITFYRGASDHFEKNLLRNSYNNIMKWLVRKYATKILSNSESALNYFFSNKWENDSRFDVVYNGVDATPFLSEKQTLRSDFGIPDSAFVVGHTGRYDKSKNHKMIISVAERLISQHSDIYFILCGNGVKANLAQELRIKGLSNKVFVFENRRDIPRFLNSMDCYFFPSITEGQPNALIEALVVGLPYVASNISSIKEVVFSLDHLYDPDDAESFFQGLDYMYNNRTGKDLTIQKRYIEKFDHRKCFNKFYEKLSI